MIKLTLRPLALLLLAFFASCYPAFARDPSPHHAHHTLAAMTPRLARAASFQRTALPQRPAADSVIFVVLDGVRWQDIFEGTDPRLSHAVARAPNEYIPTLTRWATAEGSSLGAPGYGEMNATGPNFVSLPGYTEILSGRSPTGCQSNACAETIESTFLDEVRSDFPDDDVAIISSWEPIRRAALIKTDEHTLVSTGRNFSQNIPDAWLRDGQFSGPWPGVADYRPDAYTAPLALRVLREKSPRAMFISLGDTDEYAHYGDYASYLTALKKADTFLAELESALSQMGPRGARTSVFVMCDHGRNQDFRDHGGAWPESSRTWLVARGAGIAAGGPTGSRASRLADVAPTARMLLGLDTDDDIRAGEPVRDLLR